MNVIDFAPQTETRATLVGRDPSILAEIKKSGIAATIWQRTPAPSFEKWVSELPPEQLPQIRSIVPVQSIEAIIQTACDLSNTPNGASRDLLASDIAALGEILAEMMEVSHVKLRLAVVTTNACKKFHIDNMSARLICSYRGSGTQLALPGEEDDPMSVSAGSVALLRGSKWQSEETTRLLHRSPPIEGTGETRLIVVIDPVEHEAAMGPQS